MTASNDTLVIHTEGLAKSYGSIQALKSLDLQVPQHSIYGFLGPNGAGKTTTIKLLLGLARPTGGAGRVFGLDIERDSAAIRERVGYLAQDPRYYDHMTARETLRFAAGFFYTGPKPAIEDRLQETLELVGLEDRADRPIRGFSGGERQRLGIAQAQINYPDLLILDEPAASLDPMGRHDVLDVMGRLRKHTTIFYSTHILDDVQRVSDGVAILNRGQIVAQAPIGELLAGNGAAVYTLALHGDGAAAQARLAAQPWVQSITAGPDHNGTRLRVAVSDEPAAEWQLLRVVLADPETTVSAFGRQRHSLEDAFMELVAGGEPHGH